MIYFIIAFLACTLGAVAGLGGGLVIKPSLSVLTDLPITNINLLSSITIFSMAVTTVIKRKRSNNIKLINNFQYLILGSIVGGILGNNIFNHFVILVNNSDRAMKVQALILIILISFSLILRKINKQLNVETKKRNLFITGIIFALISSFLSIGGGPVNVAVLMIVYSIDIKTATFTSILIIFSSQGAYIVSAFLNNAFATNNLLPVIVMIPGAILGGICGTKINIHLKEETLNKVFNITMIFLIFLNLLTII